MKANIIKKVQILLFISFLTFMVSCNKGCGSDKLDINVKDIEVQAPLLRFDQEMYRCKTTEDIKNLKAKYPVFYNDYVQQIRQFVPTESDPLCTAQMLEFIGSHEIYDTTQYIFSDTKFIQDGLNDAMKHFRYHFKNDSIPKFIAFVSTFDFQNVAGQDYVGIGLDMYFGKDFLYYTDSRLEFAQYFIDKLDRAYLVRNAMRAFIEQHFDLVPSPVFIEHALQQGKIYYMMDALCPEMPDTIKIQYSSEKLNWMKSVEKEMWIDLVNRKVLFSKNAFENEKYFTDGPFTNAPDVSRDSPPRVGEWLGWQIVKKYMETHSNITLSELMNEKDLMKIYKESGYRPK